MSILTDRSFRRYLDKLLVIEPFRNESLTGVGYDLTVGLIAHVDPVKRGILRVVVPNGNEQSRIELEKNTYAIVISREHIFLSKRLAGTFHSKSSLAAQAVFLNSTTCDPNWRGRLIFSLYNASGNRIALDIDQTFATFCVHLVDRSSRMHPKESKAVIEKYLEQLRGDEKNGIVGYVLADDVHKQKFESKIDAARRWAGLPFILLRLVIAAIAAADLIVRFRGTAFFLFVVGALIASTRLPGVDANTWVKNIIDSVAVLAGLATIFDFYRKFRKRRD